MKVKIYKNAQGVCSTDDFDPDVDGETLREMLETEALDAYMCGYDDDYDDDYEECDDDYDDYEEYGDDPYDYYGSLYPDE